MLVSTLSLLVIASAASGCNGDDSTGSVSSAWYAGWHSGDFSLGDVSWDKYTHLTYSFA